MPSSPKAWSGGVRALVATAVLAVVWAGAFNLTTLPFFPLITAGGVLTGLAGLWVRRGSGGGFPGWGLSRSQAALAVVVAVLHLVVAHLLFVVGVALLPQLAPTAEEVYGRTGEVSLLVGLLLGGALTAPLEEIFWRGAVQPLTGPMVESKAAWLVRWPYGRLIGTTVLYTAFHLATGQVALIAAAALGGLVWGWLLDRTGSVGATMIAHSAWTTLMLVIPPVGT